MAKLKILFTSARVRLLSIGAPFTFAISSSSSIMSEREMSLILKRPQRVVRTLSILRLSSRTLLGALFGTARHGMALEIKQAKV